MRKIRRIMVLLLGMVLVVGGIYIYKFVNNRSSGDLAQTPLEYLADNEKSGRSYYQELFDTVKKSKGDERVLLETSDISITKNHDSAIARYNQGENRDKCAGIAIVYLAMKNNSASEMSIENTDFSIYLDNKEIHPQNEFENSEYGTYKVDSFPLVLQPGEKKDVFLAFEYSVPGGMFDADATEEEKQSFIYESSIYYDGEKLPYTSIIVSCISVMHDKN